MSNQLNKKNVNSKKHILKNIFNCDLLAKILIILLLIINIVCPFSFADDEDEEEIDNTNSITNYLNQNEIESIETSAVEEKEPILNAKSAIIYDRTSKRVLWGKNIEDKRAMASTTKIMTATVVLENANLQDVVVISKKAAGTGGSRLKINTGDKITVNDLLYGLMLRSR